MTQQPMHTPRRHSVPALAATLALAAGAPGGVVEWNSNSNGFWNQGPRWSSGMVPGALDDVVISRPGADPLVQIFDGPYTINSLLVDNRLTFLNGSDLTVSNGVELNGPVFMFGNSRFTVNGAANLNGNFTLAEQSTLTINSVANIIGATSLDEDATIVNNGAINVAGTLNATSGSLVGGVLTRSPGSSVGFGSNFTLDAVTLDGDFNLPFVSIRNGLQFNGTSATNSPNVRMNFVGGDQTISGGTFVMTGGTPNQRRLFVEGGSTLTLDTDVSIVSGLGIIRRQLDETGIAGLINNGTISSVVPGQEFAISTDFFTNAGTLEVLNGASMSIGGPIGSGSWSSPGTIRVVDSNLFLNGTMDLSDVTWDRTGGNVILNGELANSGRTFDVNAATGSIELRGAVDGGTVRFSDGQTFTAGGGTLRGVTTEGDLTVSGFNAALGIENGATINGVLSVDGEDAQLFMINSGTIGGDGEIRFVPGPSASVDRFLSVSFGESLTIGQDLTIAGGGGLIGGSIQFNEGELINNGTIVSDQPGEQLIIATSTMQNNGTMRVTDGELLLGGNAANTITNAGEISVAGGLLDIRGAFQQSGGSISITGGSVQLTGDLLNQNSTLTLDGPNALWVIADGGAIRGGTVEVLNGGQIDGDGGTLDGVSFLGDLNIMQPFGSVHLENGTTVSGEINLLGNNSSVGFDGTQTFDNATFNLEPSMNGNTIDIGTQLTLGPGVVVQGAGGGFNRIGSGGGQVLINQGLVSANQPGSPLTTFSNGVTINQGVMEARNGGTLRMDGDWSNVGVLRVDGGTLQLDGQFTEGDVGTIDRAGPGQVQVTGFLQNAGNTLDLAAGVGPIVLNGGQISGGTLQLDSPNLLGFSANTENSIGNLTINGDVEMGGAGDFLNIDGHLTHNGSLNLTEPGAQVTFRFNSTYSGGTVVFDGGVGDRTRFGPTSDDPRTLTLDTDVLVRGGNGRLGVDSLGNQITAGQGSNTRIINDGVISADVDGQSILIAVDRFVNNGRVETVNGGSFEFLSPVFVDPAQNHGTFSITGDTSMVSPGELINQPTGEIEFNVDATGAGLVSFQEQITLDGQLAINYAGGLDTQISHAYDIIVSDSIVGSFDSVSLPSDTSEFTFDLVFESSFVRLLLTPFDPSADPLWQLDNLGRLGDGDIGGSLTPLTVPAPSTLALITLAALGRRRRNTVA